MKWRITLVFFVYWLDSVDRWLCFHLPHPFRLWWCEAWVRRDEFHPSLDMDSNAILKMGRVKGDDYLLRLIHRRDLAHERDFTLNPPTPIS